mmetsp:Transcript_32403/g.58908  ORF Transcript_32403/g.58908 Transcript_32403/m.58908 type:complete len:442 (+) Transcript_32403:91-1416(+)|eukprot:CAMPEP_0197639766 /NCGR_PEP_ID=MMETSP1338-20131121/14287_1 /TAXON_ID=43686 ORGANISM="Pelagodinium beii, Strain RCC1491" /NCGR_SAMPLE_ID=MMETSP1338 /ASSEMBLY_ACC=CAM_ASM_000754 /LENGTH=441 /DNA_ID=CAMNT_0043212537 /DNA_START=91 /DNA_END=1416 /DNA_ORIENTATION=-
MAPNIPVLLGCVSRSPDASVPETGPQKQQIKRGSNSLQEKEKDKVLERLLQECIAHGVYDAWPKLKDMLATGFEASGLDIPYRRCPRAFSMIYKQCQQEGRYSEPLGIGNPCQWDQVFYQRALRCIKFAGAAYLDMSDKKAIASTVGGIAEQHVLFINKEGSVQCPCFYVAADPVMDAIILAVRGTASIADVFTDGLVTPSRFLGMNAHSGSLQSAIAVIDRARSVLERLMLARPDRKVIFVGHSLGAATAILASLDMFGEDSEHYDYMQSDKVECWAFGPPPVLSHPELLPECAERNIFTFVHNFDIVPRACPVAICKLLSALDFVNRHHFSRFRWLRGKVPAEQLPDFVELSPEQSQKVEESLGKYRHAGHLRLLRSGLSEVLHASVTDRCLIHPCMANDHLVSSYEAVLQKLAGCDEQSIASIVPHLKRQANLYQASS